MTAIIWGDKGTDNKLYAKGTELGSGIRTTVASMVQAVAVRSRQGKRNARSTGDNFQKSREQAVQFLQDNMDDGTHQLEKSGQGQQEDQIDKVDNEAGCAMIANFKPRIPGGEQPGRTTKLTTKPDVRWSPILNRGYPAESSQDERKIKAAEKEAIPDRKKSGLHHSMQEREPVCKRYNYKYTCI